MKILNIIQCSNLGGMEKSTLESMVALRDAGHEVRMLSMHPVGALRKLAESSEIPLDGQRKYLLSGLGNIPHLLRVIKRYRPDRIWLTGHNFGSMIAAGLSGVPTYLSIHFHHHERSMILWRIFYLLAKRICKGVRFNSKFIFREVEHLFIDSDNIRVFYNIFREPERLREKREARFELGIPEHAFVVGNAGWLIPRKAFDVFLQTAALVKPLVPDAFFLIAGDGPERERLERTANELGIRESVTFLGWQNDLEPFYCAIDLLLFNSHFDSLSRTPVEALCHGIPIVASETNGGLEEFVRHGTDGFLIKQHDTRALAEEITKLYNQPALLQQYARSGRNRVLELGSPKRHLESLKEIMGLV